MVLYILRQILCTILKATLPLIRSKITCGSIIRLDYPPHQGPTHRLEIHPVESDTSFHNGTVLRMSDLSGEGEGGEVVVEQRGGSPYEEKIESLQTKVGALKAEV